MSRHAEVIRLRPEHRDAYVELHANAWPEVLEALTRHNVNNYSIYLHSAADGDLLFSYYEYTGDDREADLAAIAADPVTQRWWTITEPMQQRLEGATDGEWWSPLPEVFHLD